MIKSIYAEYIDRIFPSLTSIMTKVNGKKTAETYLHKTMLRNVHSTDKKWESASVNNIYVAADMVAMDSPLPIKSRQRIATAGGKLPKVGMLKQMSETDINDVDNLIQRNAAFAEIAKVFTDDVNACSIGIDEKNEYNFLYALSRGYVLVEDADNVGVGMRVDFGYLPRNTYGITAEGHVSLEDILRVLSAADAAGVSISTIAISLTLYNKLRYEQWAKELVANYRGMTFGSKTTLPVPSSQIFDEAFADETNGVKFLKIDRTVYIEKNGKRVPHKPFAADKMIFLPSEQVGALVWGDLAEATHQVGQAKYQTIDQYKLIARFADTNPLREYTTGQALVLPVIEGVDEIFILDMEKIQTVDGSDATEEGAADGVITIFGHRYDKSAVIAALATLNVSMTLSNSDAEVIDAVNTLSQAKQGKLKKAIIFYPEVTPVEVNFLADGEEKVVDIATNDKAATITATPAAAWVTANVADGKVSLVAAANDGAIRTTNVTISVGDRTATVVVSQAAKA